jgi:hypothetical protein
LHSNVDLASFDLKANLADVAVVGVCGPSEIDVCGAILSALHAALAPVRTAKRRAAP